MLRCSQSPTPLLDGTGKWARKEFRRDERHRRGLRGKVARDAEAGRQAAARDHRHVVEECRAIPFEKAEARCDDELGDRHQLF